jgi:Rv0078B-related antitoxin
VSPEAATEMQIERYRRMTGEERMKLGFDLFRLACDVARAGICSQHPDADEAEVERLLKERLALARSL